MKRQQMKVKVRPSTWVYKICVTLGRAILGYVSFPFALSACLSLFHSFFTFLSVFSLFFLTTNVNLPVSTLAASFSSHSTFILFIFVSYFSHSWPHCCLVLCCVSVILLISLFYFFIYRQMKQTHTLTSKHSHMIYMLRMVFWRLIVALCIWYSYVNSFASFILSAFFAVSSFRSGSSRSLCVCVFFFLSFVRRVLCMCFDSLYVSWLNAECGLYFWCHNVNRSAKCVHCTHI